LHDSSLKKFWVVFLGEDCDIPINRLRGSEINERKGKGREGEGRELCFGVKF